MNVLSCIVAFFILWFLFCMIMKVVVNDFNRSGFSERDIKLKIKMRKRKRFLKKVDPIWSVRPIAIPVLGYKYELVKHELGWEESGWVSLLSLLIPWPTDILRFTYVENPEIFPIEEDIFQSFHDPAFFGTPKDFYEAKAGATRKERETIEMQRNDKKSREQKILNIANKTFNENFEK